MHPRYLRSSLPVACAVALFLASGRPLAGQMAAPSAQAPSAPAQETKPIAAAPIRGELTDVDTKARTLSVMTASGTSVEFVYNDATLVSGAKDGVAGLATMENAEVAVHFSEDAKTKTKTATRIEVQPRAAEGQSRPAPSPAEPR